MTVCSPRSPNIPVAQKRTSLSSPSSRAGFARASASSDTKNIAVLGASGYTGAEVVRMLALHPCFNVSTLTGDSKAGLQFSDVFPHLLTATDVPALVKIDDVNWDGIDGAFCCLPHATTQATLASLPSHVKIVDLSADFRLKNVNTYAEWYGGEHQAPELQREAVYGLTELNRKAVLDKPRLVANPGCYPTCVQLGLVPLLEKGLISTEDIIIDAKSGISGAGRSAKQNLLYCEATEGVNAYGITKHRHMPEIEQGLSESCGKDVRVSFTPHLMPMSRGMETASYVKLSEGVTVEDLREALESKYNHEAFVHILKPGVAPHTHHVKGTNNAMINVFEDRLSQRAIVISVIDNLVKGASGQAIQNMNLLFSDTVVGLSETSGLLQQCLYP
jgi:N-acetyl-gamma-glutamyl-phosphate reductase